MLKLIIIRFFKIIKSLLNLFLSLIIKFIKTFSFLILIKKYYYIFKFIFIFLKRFKHYYIYKYFIKSLAVFIIILSGFTIFILTDYQYHDYITLMEQNLNEYDLFIQVKNYINKIIKYISDLFSIENIKVDVPENNIHDNSREKVENKIPKEFLYFIAFTTFSFAISFVVYNNYIDFNLITAFFTDFLKGNDDPGTSATINIPTPDIKSKDVEIPNIVITEFTSSSPVNIPSPDLPHVCPSDSITILSPNMFIYTKDGGEKGDKLLDGVREILDKIL